MLASTRLASEPPRAIQNDGARLPPELAACERTLVHAFGEVRLLGAATPRNAESERARAMTSLASAGCTLPRWTYARHDARETRRALEAAARSLDGQTTGLARAYAARAEELALEAQMLDHVGTAFFGELAKRRFSPRDLARADEATALARAWIAEPAPSRDAAMTTSDAPGPGSLITAMEEALRHAGAKFTVIVRPDLVALAATGERHVLIAAGRALTAEDVARTVMHEVDAHVMPRVRADRATFAIFRVGSARGVDEQEGLALVFEERHGFFTPRRKRELAARHLAVTAMHDGATFVDAVALAVGWSFPPRDAVAIAERAFRGGDGVHAGLGRERVYLESYLSVRARIREQPQIEAVLAAGQVALDAADDLAPYAVIA